MTTLRRALLIAALSVPFAASAQDAPTGSSPTQSPTAKTTESDTAEKKKLSDKDLQIISHYHADNLMEIELGKLAKKRGTSQAVKSYGDMLVKDHSAFDKKLSALVKDAGQTIPAHVAENDAEKEELANAKKTAAGIKKLTGARFEREYLSFMVSDHHNVLAKIDAHVAEAEHPDLADLLRNVKPDLQRHHDQARELQQKEPQAMKSGPGSPRFPAKAQIVAAAQIATVLQKSRGDTLQ